jgi:molybdate transport system ATP-binding protein
MSAGKGLEFDGTVRVGEFDLAVSLIAEPGEVLAVLGPNGAGKSTLLRAVSGLLALDSGALRLSETVLDDPARGVFLAPQQRRLGVVFQDHRLFPHLRVLDNVAFGPRSRGATKAAARASAAQWLTRLGLAELARRRPRQLSGGQAQRVALARAFLRDAPLVLLDEPTAHLDPATEAEVLDSLKRLCIGRTAVIASHSPALRARFPRVLELAEGRVVNLARAAGD